MDVLRQYAAVPRVCLRALGGLAGSRGGAHDLFGDVSFTDTNRLTVPPSAGTRHQTSFYAAAREAATSRLYGGIHYPMGIDVGIEQGTKVGELILNRVQTLKDD
ncbi:hypothetical protein BH24CHL10_BH24CHL10_14020 [soil metagenome]